MKKAARKQPAHSVSRKAPTKRMASPTPVGVARALLVGLTHVDPGIYRDENGHPWDGREGCYGCDDDVAAIRSLLEREGYVVTTLMDERATIESVTVALTRAAESTAKGDTFFLYYSGHGGRISDQGQGELGRDEDDGWDETLCLFDGQLRDDDLNEAWVSFPKGSAIYVLSDSCRSGSNYRGFGREKQIVDFIRDLNGDSRMKASLLHIGGCRDEENSEGLVDGGVFTKAVTRIWNKGRYRGSWETFYDAVFASISEGQRPQGNLYGPDSRLLSKRRPFEPLGVSRAVARELPSTARETPTITLESVAGLHGGASRGPGLASPGTASLDELGKPGSAEFMRSVQVRLAHFGLYDQGAIDGSPGPFTDWALGEFKLMAGTTNEAGIGPRTAHALLHGDVDSLFPMKLAGSSLAAKTMRLMVKKRHWICRHSECVNIVYLEGVNSNGSLNNDKPNVFNDLRMVIQIKGGKPIMTGIWEGTTEPGKFYTEKPISEYAEVHGAARIAFGQYYAWSPGDYLGMAVLRQARDISVCRDLNKDYEREGDKLDTGMFAIHQHGGFDSPLSNIGKSSAGCLVGRSMDGHREFMELVSKDARFRASNGYKFTTAVMHGRDL